MMHFKYMKLALNILPTEITDQYNLRCLACPDGLVYLEIRKGMPSLKQAVRISNDCLTAHIAKFGYAPVPCTTSLWKHSTLDISFGLVVDNFGIKYVDKQNANHLIQALQKVYTISINWYANLFSGLTIARN